MAKRLTRAKQKIAQAADPVPGAGRRELPGRLAGVAATVYLIFNEGYAAGAGADLVRVALTAEAVRLARLLAGLMPDEPTVLGLLALLLLQDARRDARVDGRRPAGAAGRPGPRPLGRGRDQRGRRAGRRGAAALRPDRPDPYVVQAAIAACHALAPSYAETELGRGHLLVRRAAHRRRTPRSSGSTGRSRSPNATGPPPGSRWSTRIDGLDDYPWWHATRAELLHRLGRPDAARAAYQRALALGMSEPQAEHLRRRLAELG